MFRLRYETGLDMQRLLGKIRACLPAKAHESVVVPDFNSLPES